MAVTWLGYNFEVYDPSITTWNAYPGVYIFTGINYQQERWVPLYVGQADSFRNRLSSHERWSQATQWGATHVHAMVVQQEANRGAIERNLIAAFQPPLNIHHRRAYVNPWSLLAQSIIA